MAIIGTKRESGEFVEQIKYVGLFEGRVVAINPTPEEYEKLTGIAPKEDSKEFDYLGESRDGNTYLRINVWLEDIQEREEENETVNKKFKVSFYLEDKIREARDSGRTQYINVAGKVAWADDENKLGEWFKKRSYREAHVGEEQLYKFLRMWLRGLDFDGENINVSLDWRRLMRGNVSELREQMGGEYERNVVALATIETNDKAGEIREYQKVYNGSFAPAGSIKFFKLLDFDSPEMLSKLANKPPLKRKPHESFVLDVTRSDYGCRDFYILKELKLYDPKENEMSSTNAVLNSDDPNY